MSVSGQSSARPAGLFFVEPIPALGIVPLRKTKDPPSAMCSWPPSAGLFFLKTEADFLEDATVGAAQHLSARRCAPMSDQARRRRRLSSITRAPCRNVMGVPSDRKRRSGTKKMPRLGRGCRGHCGVGC